MRLLGLGEGCVVITNDASLRSSGVAGVVDGSCVEGDGIVMVDRGGGDGDSLELSKWRTKAMYHMEYKSVT